jgi:hypothetical protein
MEEMAYCSSVQGLRQNGSDRWLTTDDDGEDSVSPSHGSQSALQNNFGEKVSDNEDASGSQRSEEFAWQQDDPKQKNLVPRRRKVSHVPQLHCNLRPKPVRWKSGVE